MPEKQMFSDIFRRHKIEKLALNELMATLNTLLAGIYLFKVNNKGNRIDNISINVTLFLCFHF